VALRGHPLFDIIGGETGGHGGPPLQLGGTDPTQVEALVI